MKISTAMMLALVVIGTPGCERHSDQLSGLGKIRSPKGTWEIELLEESPGLRIKELQGEGFRSPVQWTTAKGAFVFVDSNEIIWAFDGIGRVFILEKVSDARYDAWDLAGWKRSVPEAFLKRLPASVASQAGQSGRDDPAPSRAPF